MEEIIEYAVDPVQPAKRTDEIGQLVNTIIGSTESPPDPQAIPLLIDQLIGEGRHHEAADLRKWAISIALQYDHNYRRNRQFAVQWANMFVNDWGYIAFDLFSTVNILDARVKASLKPAEEKAGNVTLETVKVKINGPAPRIGRTMNTSNGRRGTVVSFEPGGWVNLLLNPEEDLTSESPNQMSMSSTDYADSIG